jgi:tetratricopeptide (TPR) repeat protein
VVDHPAASGQGLLLLPFAAAEHEALLGRQVGLLLQRRLQIVPDLAVGHGLLVAVTPDTRQYVSLPRPLAADKALTCGAGWHATAVLYGTIALHPTLRWTFLLRDVATGSVLLEDTVIGDPDDLPAAPSSVARAIAQALGYTLADEWYSVWDEWGTARLDALLAYLQAADIRPQHGVTTAEPAAMRVALLRACVLDPVYLAPAYSLITDLIAADDMAQAVIALHEAARLWEQQGAAALVRLAALAEERGATRLAELVVAAVLEWYPADGAALELAARQAFRARRFAHGRALVNALLDSQQDHIDARMLLGELLAAEGRYAGAAQQWELVLEQCPEHARVLPRLGAYLATIGDYGRAHLLLRQAAAHGTIPRDALYQLGVVSYRTGAFDDGVTALRRLLEREPGSARAHALLARCYERIGRDDLAYAHDVHTVALAPASWPSTLALGYGALRRNQPAAALIAFAQTVNLRPDLPAALHGLGIALLTNAMPAEAISVLGQALALDPAGAAILCTMALAHQRAGDSLTAAHALRLAEELAPASIAVQRCRIALAAARSQANDDADLWPDSIKPLDSMQHEEVGRSA